MDLFMCVCLCEFMCVCMNKHVPAYVQRSEEGSQSCGAEAINIYEMLGLLHSCRDLNSSS